MKNYHPRLSQAEIFTLLAPRSITDQYPWGMNDDDGVVERYLKRILADVARIYKTQSKIEWNHYGSGYASFIDAWFYKPTAAFRTRKPLLAGMTGYTGLVVLFSRLSPYYVFMEGEKCWEDHDQSGASYMPSFDMVDRFMSESVSWLAAHFQSEFDRHGLIRVTREELMESLPKGVRPHTMLTNNPLQLTQFDALFYWED